MTTTTAKRVVRKGGLTKTRLVQWFQQWSAADREAKSATARKNELRDRMMGALERDGYEDDKGHLYLDLPDEIDGYSKLQRQRRVSQSIDHEAAEKLLKKKKLWEDCTEQVRVLKEDLLAQAVFEGKLTRAEFDSLVNVRETYAFVPVK